VPYSLLIEISQFQTLKKHRRLHGVSRTTKDGLLHQDSVPKAMPNVNIY